METMCRMAAVHLHALSRATLMTIYGELAKLLPFLLAGWYSYLLQLAFLHCFQMHLAPMTRPQRG